MEREQNPLVQKLKDEGKTVYSISRINSYNNCPYGYHLTYNKKQRGKDNIYSLLGGVVHDNLEAIYNNESTKENLISGLSEILLKADLMGIKFPSETIGNSWKADMNHFVNNFNKIDKRIVTEKEILFEISEGIWILGYIDAILPSDKNMEVNILDWKTSSEFKGDKLKEAGRQLIVYKLAIENLTSLKVSKVGWFMTKLCTIHYNGKTKVCSRGKWVKQISNLLKTDLKKLGIEDFVRDIYIDQAISNNNLENMPQEVQNKYKLEDCIVSYDIDQEKINECLKYIKNTVKEIEAKDKDDENEWIPVEINSKSEFFCKNLCGHSEYCEHLLEYKQKKGD